MSHLSLVNTLGLSFYQVSHPFGFGCGGCSVVGCDPARTGQWDMDPQKPSDKSAWLTAQVGNEDRGPHSFPCHWFKPQCLNTSVFAAVQTTTSFGRTPLLPTYPQTPCWPLTCSICLGKLLWLGWMWKGGCKAVALYVYFLNSTKQD